MHDVATCDIRGGSRWCAILSCRHACGAIDDITGGGGVIAGIFIDNDDSIVCSCLWCCLIPFISYYSFRSVLFILMLLHFFLSHTTG